MTTDTRVYARMFAGRLFHILPNDQAWTALCGAKPGRGRDSGWKEKYALKILSGRRCQVCLEKLAALVKED